MFRFASLQDKRKKLDVIMLLLVKKQDLRYFYLFKCKEVSFIYI